MPSGNNYEECVHAHSSLFMKTDADTGFMVGGIF